MEEPSQTHQSRVSSTAPAGGAARPTADEPVKVAVALGYAPEAEHAPRVFAAGRGAIAEQILNVAFAQGIKVREDADLVQLLAAVDVDSEIPIEAFAAVAEILVYVYRANGAAIADEASGADDASAAPFLTERANHPAG